MAWFLCILLFMLWERGEGVCTINNGCCSRGTKWAALHAHNVLGTKLTSGEHSAADLVLCTIDDMTSSN